MKPSRFQEIRLSIGLTQQELAEILCVSHPMVISHYETGFRNPSKLIQVVMSILESLPEKKKKEFLDLVKDHIKKVDSPSGRGSHGKN
jgi:transcriptional regulator with XRE-family HTH domain